MSDITIVSCGLRPFEQLTFEARDRLRSARRVFYSVYNEPVAKLALELNPSVELVLQEEGEYTPGSFRPEMYRRIAMRVVDAAPGVVVLQPGSAMVVDSITQFVLEGASERGLTTEVLPGVSSVEAILCAMEYDLADGLQVILAQRLVLHRRALDPGMAAIILQPGYYDTLWYAGAARSRPDRLNALASVMMEIWSGDTPMALVLVPFLGAEKPQILWFRLRNITSLSAAISPSHSIFVPPAIRSETDRVFERRISSWDELTTHLETELTGITEWFASPDLDPSMQSDAEELERRWKERPRHPFPEVRKAP